MIILLMHVALCVIYIILQVRYGEKRQNPFPSVIVFVLPIFGFLMYVVDQYVLEGKDWKAKEFHTEKMKVTDARYKHVVEDIGTGNETMVPLEDAMSMDDAKLRRSLILDILHKNPEEYLSTLERAKASDDVEVTHYATTTLLEIQSEFEQKLQDYQKKYLKGKWDRFFLESYVDCLKRYTESGLIDGSVLFMQQEKMMEILTVVLRMPGANREDSFLYIETALNLKKYNEAEKILVKTKGERLESEQWNKLAVRFCWETGQTARIDEILECIHKNNMYLSKEGKEWFRFWSKGRQYESKEI